MGAHEAEIKAAVARELAASSPGALTLFEVGLCQHQARADIVSLSQECLHAIEVKSEADTLRRLPGQVRLYSQVADRCTLVVAEKHAEKAEALVPSWWGLWVSWGPILEERRGARINPSPDPLATARLLWREEALDALRHMGRAKGLSRAGIHRLHRELVEAMPHAELRHFVRLTLLSRTGWSRRGSRTAEDGVVILPEPEPEDVFNIAAM